MFSIEITVDIQGIETNAMEALMVGVVQLPCVPVNGMQLLSPDDSSAELELSDVLYCLRRKMFVGLLTDTAFSDDTESVIKSWEEIGFTCDWRRKDDATE